MLFWVHLLLFCLFGSFAAGAEGLEIQLPDLGRHGFRHDRLPVDLRTAETIAHGAEEHHVHTLGIAKLDGDVAGGNGDGCLLYTSDAADEMPIDYFIGYKAIINEDTVGEIVDVDDSTANVLFRIEVDDKELLVPAVDEFVVDIDTENETIELDVPTELLDL